MSTSLQHQWNTRYTSGNTPWDSGQTPPEVTSFWSSGRLPSAGRALDLGCGTGTNVAYLAGLGLQVTGVEFAAAGLQIAAQRMGELGPGLQRRMDFVQADVARLPFVDVAAAYILDIGCLHGVPLAQRADYAAGVIDNLKPGGYYHLFAFDRHPHPPADNPELAWRGMADNEVETLFAPALKIVDVIHGDPDHAPCRWYLLQRH